MQPIKNSFVSLVILVVVLLLEVFVAWQFILSMVIWNWDEAFWHWVLGIVALVTAFLLIWLETGEPPTDSAPWKVIPRWYRKVRER